MTSKEPPRLALALLHRFGPDNEALAGDLVEEFQRRRSRLWLWRQVIAAIAIATFRSRPLEIRPLHLVDKRITPLRVIEKNLRPIHNINLSGSPLPGIGGLSIIIVVLFATVMQPALWTLAMIALVAGVACGFVKIKLRQAVASRAKAHDLHIFEGRSSPTATP
jgi:hypothetical protein